MVSKNKKFFAFIDVDNIKNAAIDFGGYEDFDYNKLCNWLLKKKNISRIYLYVAIDKTDKQKMSYFEKLGKVKGCFVNIKEVIPYYVKSSPKKVTCPQCKFNFKKNFRNKIKRKGNCDAELTLDVVKLGVRKKYGGIIVFSGDGDFAQVYEYVKKELKRNVMVYAPSGKISYRTSNKIKKLNRDGLIIMESLTGIIQHYGIKI